MFSTGRRFDRATALFLSLLAVAFIVATFDVRSQGEGAGGILRGGAQTLFTPLQKATDFVTAPIVGFIDGVANVAGLRDENERLRDRVNDLEQQIQETTAMERRIEELEAILGLEAPQSLSSVTAGIYSSGPGAFDQVRWIDTGSEDGIVVGLAVIDERGLVGRIDLVTADGARVRLITDPLVSIGVRVQETNETGIATGRGSGPLRLEMFDATQAVREGYLVVTDGTRFPPGIVVGTVAETADTEVGFALRSTIHPSVEFGRLDFVKVVVGWSPLDAGVSEDDDGVVDPPPSIDTGVEQQ
jgi:rod shape-determining protein MreC